MNLDVIGQAIGMFAVTNIDDILVLALFFGQLAGHPGRTWKVALGQYLGFGAILAAAVVGAFAANLLPQAVLPYLGLLPLLLGLRAAVRLWRERRRSGDSTDQQTEHDDRAPGPLQIAAVTLANGGDNIGVYVPVFAVAGAGGLVTFVVVFLIMLAVWIAAGRLLATRPPIARALSRWGHILLPVVLIGIGLLVLIEGGAFGL